MPCLDDRRYDDERELRASLNLATRVACELAKKMPPDTVISSEAREWIEEHRRLDAERETREAAQKAEPYGRCPHCGAPGASREKRPDGNDRCPNGHVYPSRAAVK